MTPPKSFPSKACQLRGTFSSTAGTWQASTTRKNPNRPSLWAAGRRTTSAVELAQQHPEGACRRRTPELDRFDVVRFCVKSSHEVSSDDSPCGFGGASPEHGGEALVNSGTPELWSSRVHPNALGRNRATWATAVGADRMVRCCILNGGPADAGALAVCNGRAFDEASRLRQRRHPRVVDRGGGCLRREKCRALLLQRRFRLLELVAPDGLRVQKLSMEDILRLPQARVTGGNKQGGPFADL